LLRELLAPKGARMRELFSSKAPQSLDQQLVQLMGSTTSPLSAIDKTFLILIMAITPNKGHGAIYKTCVANTKHQMFC